MNNNSHNEMRLGSQQPITLDAWQMHQRALTEENRRKQHDAAENLHNFRGGGLNELHALGKGGRSNASFKDAIVPDAIAGMLPGYHDFVSPTGIVETAKEKFDFDSKASPSSLESESAGSNSAKRLVIESDLGKITSTDDFLNLGTNDLNSSPRDLFGSDSAYTNISSGGEYVVSLHEEETHSMLQSSAVLVVSNKSDSPTDWIVVSDDDDHIGDPTSQHEDKQDRERVISCLVENPMIEDVESESPTIQANATLPTVSTVKGIFNDVMSDPAEAAEAASSPEFSMTRNMDTTDVSLVVSFGLLTSADQVPPIGSYLTCSTYPPILSDVLNLFTKALSQKHEIEDLSYTLRSRPRIVSVEMDGMSLLS